MVVYDATSAHSELVVVAWKSFLSIFFVSFCLSRNASSLFAVSRNDFTNLRWGLRFGEEEGSPPDPPGKAKASDRKIGTNMRRCTFMLAYLKV
jgi:hypothetical protein